MNKVKLNLGCGTNHIEGFVNIDIQEDVGADLVGNAADLPYPEDSVDLIYSCCMLEHFGKNSNLKFFRNISWIQILEHWYSRLKDGGELYVSTVDFNSVCREYLQNKNLESLIGITLGGQKNEEDLHGMLFDYELVSRELKAIGYKNIGRYQWQEFEAFDNPGYDDFSRAYLPHMDFEKGRLMTLNIRAQK